MTEHTLPRPSDVTERRQRRRWMTGLSVVALLAVIGCSGEKTEEEPAGDPITTSTSSTVDPLNPSGLDADGDGLIDVESSTTTVVSATGDTTQTTAARRRSTTTTAKPTTTTTAAPTTTTTRPSGPTTTLAPCPGGQLGTPPHCYPRPDTSGGGYAPPTTTFVPPPGAPIN